MNIQRQDKKWQLVNGNGMVVLAVTPGRENVTETREYPLPIVGR